MNINYQLKPTSFFYFETDNTRRNKIKFTEQVIINRPHTIFTNALKQSENDKVIPPKREPAIEKDELNRMRSSIRLKFNNLSNIIAAYDSFLKELEYLQNQMGNFEKPLIDYANHLIELYSQEETQYTDKGLPAQWIHVRVDHFTKCLMADIEVQVHLGRASGDIPLQGELIKVVYGNRDIEFNHLFQLSHLVTKYMSEKQAIINCIRNIWPRITALEELRNEHLYTIKDENTLGRKRTLGLEDIVLKKWNTFLLESNGIKSRAANLIIEEYMLQHAGSEVSSKTVLNTVKRLEKNDQDFNSSKK